MYNIKAFIFDLNGTIIDDMEYHLMAWNYIINEKLKGNLTVAEVKKNMYGKNEEVLERVFGPGRFSKKEMQAISMEKEEKYRQAYFPNLQLINGLPAFFEQAVNHNIQLAIATASVAENLDQILDRLDIRKFFSAMVHAGEVSNSKPDPETFLKVAEKLGVLPEDCLVFEDAPKGVAAAQNARMRAIAITTTHDSADFLEYSAVDWFIKDYTDPALRALIV